MKPINVFEFIDFGVTVQTLRWFLRVDGASRRPFAAIKQGQLEEFRDHWLIPQNVGVDLINYAISRLDSAVDESELYEQLQKTGQWEGGPKPHDVNWEFTISEVVRTLNELMTVLEHECPKFPVLFVSPTRAFDTTILMNEAERALSEISQKRLSEHSRQNWREAGRCLAVDAPTAAAFQMLRVTEGTIKTYRKVVTGTDAAEADGLSEHINALKASVPETVMTALRSLKNAHRNPTMHPGKNLTNDEAVSLFGLCTSVIDFVSADMDFRERPR